MVWKLQGSPAPASQTKIGLSTSPQPPTHSTSGRPGQPFLGGVATIFGRHIRVATALVFLRSSECTRSS